MSAQFSLLWGKILDSSIWVKESKETRLVWITLLAMKDREGHVYASRIGLADRAKVSPDECAKAIKIFMSPDPDDTSKVEDGIRLREIPGGWEIVNHDLYRFSTDEKREFWRRCKAESRARKKDSNPSVSGSSKSNQATTPDTKLEIPEALKTPDFVSAFDRWEKHRREIRHALTPTSRAALLKKIGEWGPARGVAAINHSIEKGWQGLFEPNGADNDQGGSEEKKSPKDWDREMTDQEILEAATQ